MKYFLIILFCSVFFLSCTNEQKNKQTSSTSVEKKVIKTTPIVKGGLSIISKLPAQFAAYQEVSIFPKVNGYVKKVLVDIGSKVSAGQLLMTLEAPELEQASASAKAEFEKAKSDYEINKENYNRLLEASKTEGAVSAMDLALDKSKVSSSLATMNAAQANWQEQETMLQYLQVHAPFSGVITARNVHPGALVSNSIKDVPMLELKQEALLRLQVDVPENIVTNLNKGDSVVFIIPSLDNKKMRGIISRIANNINPEFRSERVELDVVNDGTLSSGMYADVAIRSSQTPDVFHVVLSAVHGEGEKYINIIKHNKTFKTPVTVYKQSADSVEIKGDFNDTDSIEVD